MNHNNVLGHACAYMYCVKSTLLHHLRVDVLISPVSELGLMHFHVWLLRCWHWQVISCRPSWKTREKYLVDKYYTKQHKTAELYYFVICLLARVGVCGQRNFTLSSRTKKLD